MFTDHLKSKLILIPTTFYLFWWVGRWLVVIPTPKGFPVKGTVLANRWRLDVAMEAWWENPWLGHWKSVFVSHDLGEKKAMNSSKLLLKCCVWDTNCCVLFGCHLFFSKKPQKVFGRHIWCFRGVLRVSRLINLLSDDTFSHLFTNMMPVDLPAIRIRIRCVRLSLQLFWLKSPEKVPKISVQKCIFLETILGGFKYFLSPLKNDEPIFTIIFVKRGWFRQEVTQYRWWNSWVSMEVSESEEDDEVQPHKLGGCWIWMAGGRQQRWLNKNDEISTSQSSQIKWYFVFQNCIYVGPLKCHPKK